jgi:hypothetical protein
LYDPYEGNNLIYRNSTSQHSGKKYNQNGFQNPRGRQRKLSTPGSRPYHSQFANDKPGHVQSNGNRFLGPKGPGEDDPAITQDHEHGCHTNWIGPQNTTVTEVYIGDLPEDIRDAELEALFQDRIGVKPKSINARSATHSQYNHPTRKHAFVGYVEATR